MESNDGLCILANRIVPKGGKLNIVGKWFCQAQSQLHSTAKLDLEISLSVLYHQVSQINFSANKCSIKTNLEVLRPTLLGIG